MHMHDQFTPGKTGYCPTADLEIMDSRIREAVHVERNNEARSRNYSSLGREINVKYFSACMCLRVCLSAALAWVWVWVHGRWRVFARVWPYLSGTQGACATLYTAPLAQPYFSKLSHKRHSFRNKGTEYKICVLIFSTIFM